MPTTVLGVSCSAGQFHRLRSSCLSGEFSLGTTLQKTAPAKESRLAKRSSLARCGSAWPSAMAFARKRHIGHDALGIRRRGVGVRVANVHQQNHAA